jgi:hypothetical protein
MICLDRRVVLCMRSEGDVLFSHFNTVNLCLEHCTIEDMQLSAISCCSNENLQTNFANKRWSLGRFISLTD